MGNELSRSKQQPDQEERIERRARKSFSTVGDVVYGPDARRKRHEIDDPHARDRRSPGLSKKVYFELFGIKNSFPESLGIGTSMEKKKIAMKAAERYINQRDEFDRSQDPIKQYTSEDLEAMETTLELIGQKLMEYGNLIKDSREITSRIKVDYASYYSSVILKHGVNMHIWLNQLDNMRPAIVEMKGYRKQDPDGKQQFKDNSNHEQINQVRKMFQVVEHGLLACEEAFNKILDKVVGEKSFYGDCSKMAIKYLTMYFLVRGAQGNPEKGPEITMDQFNKVGAEINELGAKGVVNDKEWSNIIEALYNARKNPENNQ